ncbi:phosphoribosylglycinamide formyltransferase [Luteimonas yindakuii]|uniref:phosphoribosylglycinamide formyltransferase n=1 Tax=Luteimonas yindakuii TaxID=2565782 RepID=UPI001FC942E4|nr:phosphoribosylglycinamide formyltransferase [Luteimonas yindakuii]
MAAVDPAAAAATCRIAVLASGRGSNLQALLDAISAGTLDADVVGVFSDRAGAPALARARAVGIPAHALSPRDYPSRDAFDAALFDAVDTVAPDLIICAGYMRLLGAAVVAPRSARMINVHPSLLPDFKGLHTHRQALAAGATRHGASVHFVTADLDGGPVISQVPVPVFPGDDETSLSARVLEREHPLLVETVRLLAQRRISLGDDGVLLDGRSLAGPLQLAANNRFA